MAYTQDSRPLTLLYSNRTRAEAACLHELEEWIGGLPASRLIATFTREDSPGSKYETSRIDEGLIRRHLPEPEQCIFYLAGPDSMVLDILGMLEQMGVPSDQIRMEAFYGY